MPLILSGASVTRQDDLEQGVYSQPRRERGRLTAKRRRSAASKARISQSAYERARLANWRLMKDLDSTAATTGGGVFGYFDAANGHVIVTYAGVPAAGTTQPNTLQVVIYDSGKIEMIVGALAGTGPIYSPSILGTVGIASGQTKASDLRKVKPISFSELRQARPVTTMTRRMQEIERTYSD